MQEDEQEHIENAKEEAARHLEELAEDLETGLERTCLLRVASRIRLMDKTSHR